MATCVAVHTTACLPQPHSEQEFKEEQEDSEGVDSVVQRRRQHRGRYRLRIVELSNDEEDHTISSIGTKASGSANASALTWTVGSSLQATVQAACAYEQDSEGNLLGTAQQQRKKRRRLRRMQSHDEDREQQSALAHSDSSAAIQKTTAESAVQHDVDRTDSGSPTGKSKLQHTAVASGPAWTALPSCDAYLAAKVEEWSAADFGSTTSVPPPTTERPLTPVDELELTTAAQRERYFDKLVRNEMAWHGLLPKWRFTYDNSRTRAGSCCYSTKTLSFARGLVQRATPHEQRNTILHEISHALAGRRHHHGRVWQSIALRIGSDGRRCHDLTLADPTWRLSCPRGCWSRLCYKRSYIHRGCWCNVCGATCIYERYAPPRTAAAVSASP